MADKQSKKDSKVLKADQTPAKKEKKKEKDSKPGVLKRIGKFLREVKSELKKVIWPTPKQTAKNTGIVLVCCGAIGVCFSSASIIALISSTVIAAICRSSSDPCAAAAASALVIFT